MHSILGRCNKTRSQAAQSISCTYYNGIAQIPGGFQRCGDRLYGFAFNGFTSISFNLRTNSSLSSVSIIVCMGVPNTSTPYFSKVPCLYSSTPQFNAVWPPKASKTPCGRSFESLFPQKGSHRQEINCICHTFRRLYRSNIGIDKHRLNALFF